jgi:hypothetical protein
VVGSLLVSGFIDAKVIMHIRFTLSLKIFIKTYSSNCSLLRTWLKHFFFKLTGIYLLLPLAPQPLVRPWPPPQSSSIYPSPMPTQPVAAGSSIQPNFWRLLSIFVFKG